MYIQLCYTKFLTSKDAYHDVSASSEITLRTAEVWATETLLHWLANLK